MSERAEPGRIVMQLISRLFTTDHACSITSLLSSSPIRARVCVDSSLNITFTYLIYLNRNCIQKKAFDDRSKSISNHKYEICMLIWCLFRWNLSRALLFFSWYSMERADWYQWIGPTRERLQTRRKRQSEKKSSF